VNQDKESAAAPRISSPQGNPSLEALLAESNPWSGFFRGAWQKIRRLTQRSQQLWQMDLRPDREVMSLQGSLSIGAHVSMCGQPRGFLRSMKEQQPAEEEMEVRSAIQQIALEHGRRLGIDRFGGADIRGACSEPQKGWRGSCRGEGNNCWGIACECSSWSHNSNQHAGRSIST